MSKENLGCSLLKFLSMQTHLPRCWHSELRTKIRRRIERENRCQSQIRSWAASSGAKEKLDCGGVDAVLDSVPICNPDDDILRAFFGNNARSFEDIDYVVMRIFELLMQNWPADESAPKQDFQSAKTVYDSDFLAAQELLNRHRNRGLL